MKPIAVLASLCVTPAWGATVSPLFARGYTVMPQPQVVRLGASDFVFSRDWKVELQGVASGDAAVDVLKEELEKRFLLKLANPSQAEIGRAHV